MKRRNMNGFLKKEEGSGLVLALMTLLVLSVLGASLGTITISGFRMSDTNRDSSSAYYIAEAGANMAYEEMEVLVESAYESSTSQSEFFDTIENNFEFGPYAEFEEQFGEEPEAEISVTSEAEGESREYTIHSQSNIGNQSREVEKAVSVNWREKDNGGGGSLPPTPENAALIVNENISFTNGQIYGDIYFNSLEPNSFLISNSGTVSDNTSLIYTPEDSSSSIYQTTGDNPPLKNFKARTQSSLNSIAWDNYTGLINGYPDIPNYPMLEDKVISKDDNNHQVHNNGHLNITNYVAHEYELNLDESVYIKSLTFNSNRKLNINPNNEDVSIVIDHLDLSSGHIDIIGEGSVNLYVRSFTSGQGSINKNGNTDQLTIYYSGDEFNPGQNVSINGSLFTENASITIDNGASISGVMLSGGDSIKLEGGTHASPLLIAPNAEVLFDAGASYEGVIIVDRFNIDGGATIRFKEYNADDFPFGGSVSGDTPEPNTEDLIKSEPVIEAR